MEAALKTGAVALALAHQPVAAMRTDVMEGAQPVVSAAHHDHRGIQHLDVAHGVVTGVWQVLLAQDHVHPHGAEDRFALALEHGRVDRAVDRHRAGAELRVAAGERSRVVVHPVSLLAWAGRAPAKPNGRAGGAGGAGDSPAVGAPCAGHAR